MFLENSAGLIPGIGQAMQGMPENTVADSRNRLHAAQKSMPEFGEMLKEWGIGDWRLEIGRLGVGGRMCVQ
jgi:hypothetical protein